MKSTVLGCLLALLASAAVGGMKGVEKSFDYGTRGSARIDYGAGYIEATALGTADMKKMANSVQAEAVARRTARHLAYEILAETVGKLQIDAKTRYQDAVAMGGALQTETHAVLEGATVASDSFQWVEDPGSGAKVPRATVTVRLPLGGADGLARLVDKYLPPGTPRPSGTPPPAGAPLPPAPPAAPSPPLPPAPPEIARATEKFDALVVDAAGLEPAYEATLRPELRDERGNALYGPDAVRPQSVLSLGRYVRYAPTVEAAREALGPNSRPLVVRALSAPGKGQLLIGEKDARAILSADRTARFLEEGRVAVVVR